jgi:3-oxoacyl-[acyl-carrier protein] reductase
LNQKRETLAGPRTADGLVKKKRLDGQVALITGASRGIGAAVARLFSAEGAAVAIGHIPDPEMKRQALNLANELIANGSRAIAIEADLSDPHGAERLVEATRADLGSISIVVANAAASARASWNEITIEEWDNIQRVNLRGTWLLAKASFEDLKEHQGSFITVTSVMVETGQSGALHYSSSKAGIIGLTRALAREVGHLGIRVNSVMPGAIRTEQEEEMVPDEREVADEILPRQSLKRRGFSKDLAGTFLFLATSDSSFVTGQVICVDGGWVMY